MDGFVVIPAIDLIDGQCVRLTQGDYSRRKVYERDPLSVARRYEDAGLERLHVVDLDGARDASLRNLAVLERIAGSTGLEVQWGGGIRDRGCLDAVLDAGAARVICGSVAVTEPEEFSRWLEDVGPGRIILGADVRDGKVATHGWKRQGTMRVEELIRRYLPLGLSQVICTDIGRDGMLQGPAFALYASLMESFPEVEVTASGGIGSLEDVVRLRQMGMRSVIVGKSLYEGRISLEELAGLSDKSGGLIG